MIAVAKTSTLRSAMSHHAGDGGLTDAERTEARIEMALAFAVSLNISDIVINTRQRDEQPWVNDRQPTREQVCSECGHVFTARRWANGGWRETCSPQCAAVLGEARQRERIKPAPLA